MRNPVISLAVGEGMDPANQSEFQQEKIVRIENLEQVSSAEAVSSVSK